MTDIDKAAIMYRAAKQLGEEQAAEGNRDASKATLEILQLSIASAARLHDIIKSA